MDQYDRADAERILNALDSNKNGTIEQKEWTDWISSGLDDSQARQRLLEKANKAKDPLAQKLKQLLEATEVVVNEWIVAEGGKIERRKSFYERDHSKPSDQSSSAATPLNDLKSADQKDVDKLSRDLHHLCCREDLTARILEDFFVAQTTAESFETDIIERASKQLDGETHMTALHFLCWHENLKADMLRIFLENTGGAALAVCGHLFIFVFVSSLFCFICP